MWVLGFYRFYISVATGVTAAFFILPRWWFGLMTAIAVRAAIGCAEYFTGKIMVDRLFRDHAFAFKQELGPYGIRMVNRAEKDVHIRKSLSEVFVKDEKKLQKAVEQLEMMETLFKAGMSPDADTWQIHDLKLKYGRFRLAQLDKEKKGTPLSDAPVK